MISADLEKGIVLRAFADVGKAGGQYDELVVIDTAISAVLKYVGLSDDRISYGEFQRIKSKIESLLNVLERD